MCAALLKQLGILDDILFVHPKDVQDGKVELGAQRHHDEPAVQPGRRDLASTTTSSEAVRVGDAAATT